MEYCVNTNFITDYGVFCGINAGLFNWNETGLCTGHSTIVGGIISHKSSLFKRDSSAPSGQIVLCSDIVFTSESRGSGFEISDLTQHLALHYHGQALPDSTVIPPVIRLSEMKCSIRNNAEICTQTFDISN